MQIAPDPERRDEKPPLERTVLAGTEPAAEREVFASAVWKFAAKLDPRVSSALVPFPHQQVPLHVPIWIGVGFHAMGFRLAIEEKWQRQRERARFTGAIVAPQQQPTALEDESLIVVFVEVQQTAAERLPTF